jgi:hypothetical protein
MTVQYPEGGSEARKTAEFTDLTFRRNASNPPKVVFRKFDECQHIIISLALIL